MDYLTRRAAAASGARGIRLEGNCAKRWPRLSALGVRVELNGQVSLGELRQALIDIGEQVDLPKCATATADTLEPLLSELMPADLNTRITAFLGKLTNDAKGRFRRIDELPENIRTEFKAFLAEGVRSFPVVDGEPGYYLADLHEWMQQQKDRRA
jgi:hypothetical protein